MKIVFLDFDGVLNSARSFKKEKRLNDKDPSRKVKIHHTLCPDAVENLQSLLNQVPDLRIVISSSWRTMFPLDWLKDKLASYGLDASKVVGIIPGDDSSERGLEIQQWLNEHQDIKDYVVFDDNIIIGHGSRFIQTLWNDGLLKKHVKKALEVFGVHEKTKN